MNPFHSAKTIKLTSTTSSQTFNNKDGCGTLAYIAETAGGTVIISVGDGF